jgi:hypothetical protein
MSRTEVACSPLSKLCTLRKQEEQLAYENPDGKIIAIRGANPRCKDPARVDSHV